MRYREKSLLVFIILWVCIYTAIQFFSKHILLSNFTHLENAQMDNSLDLMQKKILQSNRELKTIANEWSTTTAQDFESYLLNTKTKFEYLSRDNADYTFLLIFNNEMRLALALNREGKLINSYQTDNLPSHLRNYFLTDEKMLKPIFFKKEVSGVILADNNFDTIYSETIVNHTNTRLGTLIVGKKVDARINDYGLPYRLVSNIYPLSTITTNQVLHNIYQQLQNKKQYIIDAKSNNALIGYSEIYDINNKPIGILEVSMSREIYRNGLDTIYNFMLILVLTALVFTVVLLFFQYFFVTRRLEKLNHEISEIGENKQFYRRVTKDGKDELTSMAKEINNMLEIVDNSHNVLEEKVRERTEKLEVVNTTLQHAIKEKENSQRELLKNKEFLAHLAHYDTLTNLPNRLLFSDIVNNTINRSKRTQQKFAILYLDLDRFKNVNDALGHTIGDELLKKVSILLTSSVRNVDTVARLSGDEFIILLENINNLDTAALICEKLLSILNLQPIIVENHTMHINASIGISVYPFDGQTLEDLQRNADMAMYAAKSKGGNRFQFYTSEMNKHAHNVIELDKKLRIALSKNELKLYYQAKVNIETEVLMGAEALVRWEDPEKGIIPPNEFIPVAEETLLIQEVGNFILKQACNDNKAWQEKYNKNIVIAVNFSAIQFQHPNIIAIVKDIIDSAALNPEYIELEITETAVMHDINTSIQKLKTFRDLGIKIALDDFGINYSSLNYLKQFPISSIKIDKAFINNIATDEKDAAIVQSIITLAKNLNLTSVAEGVETVEQLTFLRRAGCNAAQGYLFCKPMPKDEFYEKMLKEQ